MNTYFLTYKTMGNIIKSAVLATALATTPVSADAVNLQNSAPHVTVSGESIDFKSKIAQIDIKLVQIQTKIDIIEQKNELSDQGFDSIDILDKEFKKLTAEMLALFDEHERVLNRKIAVLDEHNKELDETIAIKTNKYEQIHLIEPSEKPKESS